MSTATVRKCEVCSGPATKQCSRCKDTYYCTKEHQKQDWKEHKSGCLTTEDVANLLIQNQNMKSLGQQMKFGFWKGLTQHEAYIQFIDAYRLRVEDDCAFGGYQHGLYAQESPLRDFKKYLHLASKRGKLPEWWEHSKDYNAIIEVATTDEWADIKYAVEKSDITGHYNDPSKAMTLRMLAEEIYGIQAGGFGGFDGF